MPSAQHTVLRASNYIHPPRPTLSLHHLLVKHLGVEELAGHAEWVWARTAALQQAAARQPEAGGRCRCKCRACSSLWPLCMLLRQSHCTLLGRK